MKTLIKTFLSIAFLLSTFMLNAQVDYLARARDFLAENNCKGARTYYELALKQGTPADKLLEQQIRECEEEPIIDTILLKVRVKSNISIRRVTDLEIPTKEEVKPNGLVRKTYQEDPTETFNP